MMGLAEIKRLNAEATERSTRRRAVPYVPTAAHRAELAKGNLSVTRIPFLGDYVPEGWEKKDDDRYVDISGFGSDNEPALSQRQFARSIADDPEDTGYALTEHGQFQGYVASYRKKEAA